MIKDIETKKQLASNWFAFMQKEICKQFHSLEKNISKKKGKKYKKFVKREWKKNNPNEGSYLFGGVL